MTRDEKFETVLNWNLRNQGHLTQTPHGTPHGMLAAIRERGSKMMSWREYVEIRLGRGVMPGGRLELIRPARAERKIRALRRARTVAHYPSRYAGRHSA